MLKEFKEFAVKGNVLDLAVAVIIGGAFGGIVNSLVNDVLMPPIGMILGHIDFKDLFISLKAHDPSLTSLADIRKAGVPVIAYGNFLNTVVNFAIVAFVIFLMVRAAARLQPAPPPPVPPPPPPPTKNCPYCCTAIPAAAKRCPACTSQVPV